jgi:hypothetical protein
VNTVARRLNCGGSWVGGGPCLVETSFQYQSTDGQGNFIRDFSTPSILEDYASNILLS